MLPTLAKASESTLTQFLICCPTCHRHSAVHVDESGNDGPVLVRVICPDLCSPDLGSVFDLVISSHASHWMQVPAVA